LLAVFDAINTASKLAGYTGTLQQSRATGIPMTEFIKQILKNQFEAALCMMHHCIEACPPQHWEGKIANGSFRWVTYHTLFFVDLYLSRTEHEFTLRDLHQHGGDEREPIVSAGLSKDETRAYVAICRKKTIDTLAAETRESLEGDSGFSYRRISRAELHIYNIRHIQHHTGQLSAYLGRIDDGPKDPKAIPWIGSGWR
jgi:hypothetical protein